MSELRISRGLAFTWVLQDGRCVVVHNRRPGGSSWWSLPGGGVESGETFEDAAVREVREETGLEVRVSGLDMLVDEVGPNGRWLIVEFVAHPVGGTFGRTADPTGKIQEVRWAKPDTVEPYLGEGRRARLEALLKAPPTGVYRADRRS